MEEIMVTVTNLGYVKHKVDPSQFDEHPEERHESDCSVYNMPAYPNGPCDCKYKEANKDAEQLDINLRTAWTPRDWGAS